MGVANECIPLYEPGSRITGSCEAAVTGKRFVDISDPKQGPVLGAGLSSTVEGGNIVISHAAAGKKAIGVSSHDGAIGEKVTVLGPGFVVPVTADGAITAGDLIMVGSSGKAKTYDTPALSGNAEDLPDGPYIVGKAFDSAADGAPCLVKVY